MLIFLLPLAIFIVMVGFLAVGLTLDKTRVPSPLIGKPAPDFTLPLLHNGNKQLAFRSLRGKPVVFNIWASWCVACREEHPYLEALAKMTIGKACKKENAVQDNRPLVSIYGLNYKDKRKAALNFLEKMGNPYVASVFDKVGRIGIDWGVYAVPETFIVDQKGIVRYKRIGVVNATILQKNIVPLLCKLQLQS